MTRQFHRPARLNPELAEAIEGTADIAATSELAHRTAGLLIGLPAPAQPAGPTQDEPLAITRQGVVEVANKGVDEVAELWADSPATTLPGTLWRLFLLREWVRRDPALVAQRYATTVDLSAQDPASPEMARLEAALPQAHRAPSPQQVRERIDAVLTGATSGLEPVASVSALASAFLRALAAGSNDTWIDQDTDELAHQVTRRAAALLETAAELSEAARRAQAGTLS